jgi:hypothetical protein
MTAPLVVISGGGPGGGAGASGETEGSGGNGGGAADTGLLLLSGRVSTGVSFGDCGGVTD